jgi:hypothetical protein
MKHLIGCKFKYKSKYGLSDWTDEVVDVRESHISVKGIGDPIKFLETKMGTIPLHKEYDKKQIYYVLSSGGVRYELDEIEIIG